MAAVRQIREEQDKKASTLESLREVTKKPELSDDSKKSLMKFRLSTQRMWISFFLQVQVQSGVSRSQPLQSDGWPETYVQEIHCNK